MPPFYFRRFLILVVGFLFLINLNCKSTKSSLGKSTPYFPTIIIEGSSLTFRPSPTPQIENVPLPDRVTPLVKDNVAETNIDASVDRLCREKTTPALASTENFNNDNEPPSQTQKPESANRHGEILSDSPPSTRNTPLRLYLISVAAVAGVLSLIFLLRLDAIWKNHFSPIRNARHTTYSFS